MMGNNKYLAAGIMLSAAVFAGNMTVCVSAGEIEMIAETDGEEMPVFWDEPTVMYAVDDVYIRKTEELSSEAVKILHRGERIFVLGEINEKYIVDYMTAAEDAEKPECDKALVNDLVQETEEKLTEDLVQEVLLSQSGFVGKSYLTENREEAENAVKAEAYAQALAAPSQVEISAEEMAAGGTVSARTQIGKQDYFDCDGSGHGYSVITYSDGSSEITEF